MQRPAVPITGEEGGGAQVQRPLWASTSTKNPDFDPLLYVTGLAAADTVNTLPPATLATLIDEGGKCRDTRAALSESFGKKTCRMTKDGSQTLGW